MTFSCFQISIIFGISLIWYYQNTQTLMMVGHADKIQQLLTAEQKGQELINKAKKNKTMRLMEAKEEAEEEINEYKEQWEIKYKAFEKKNIDDRIDFSKKLMSETKIKIEDLNKAVSVNKNEVINTITEIVYDVRPEVPKNFILSKNTK